VKRLLLKIWRKMSKELSGIPICTKSFGYHSATDCRSYGRPKIRPKPTFIKSAFGGF
jgi:hypothetical protein